MWVFGVVVVVGDGIVVVVVVVIVVHGFLGLASGDCGGDCCGRQVDVEDVEGRRQREKWKGGVSDSGLIDLRVAGLRGWMADLQWRMVGLWGFAILRVLLPGVNPDIEHEYFVDPIFRVFIIFVFARDRLTSG